MWRSLASALGSGPEVAGSNPVIPTIFAYFADILLNPPLYFRTKLHLLLGEKTEHLAPKTFGSGFSGRCFFCPSFFLIPFPYIQQYFPVLDGEDAAEHEPRNAVQYDLFFTN